MQRMICADHSFRTGKSHTTFFHEHQLEPPRGYLRRLCLNLLHRQDLRATDCSTVDILHRVVYRGPQTILEMLDQLDPSDRWQNLTNFSCSICALDFSDAAQLTKHMKQVHHVLHRTPHFFRYDLDATTGPPQCAHCGTSFQSWTKLLRTPSSMSICRLSILDTAAFVTPSTAVLNAAIVALSSKRYGTSY